MAAPTPPPPQYPPSTPHFKHLRTDSECSDLYSGDRDRRHPERREWISVLCMRASCIQVPGRQAGTYIGRLVGRYLGWRRVECSRVPTLPTLPRYPMQSALLYHPTLLYNVDRSYYCMCSGVRAGHARSEAERAFPGKGASDLP